MDLITFDLDQTLIKANKCHWGAFNEAFANFGIKKVSFKKINKFLDGRHASEVIKSLFPRMGLKEIHLIRNEHHKLIANKYGKCAKQITGVVDTLKKLKTKYNLGVITNCTHQEINSLLNGAKISKKLFNIIVGKDDVKHSKPYPDEIFKAEKLTHHKVKYHIGDSIYDIIAAKRANVKAISVLTGVNTRKQLEKEKPFMILKSVNGLPKVLL